MAECTKDAATRKPDEAALIDERATVTWAQLDERVNRAINGLRAADLQPDDVVAVLCGNRNELFEASLACMHTSLIIVPVNWHWVTDELEYVLHDSGAKAIIVEDAYLDTALEALGRLGAAVPVRVLVGDEVALPSGFVAWDDLLDASDAEEPPDQTTGGPMFYTSGTTGFPKGVRGSLTRTGELAGLWQLVGGSICGMLGLPTDGVTLLDGPAYHSAQWAFSFGPLIGATSTVVMRQKFDAAATLATIDRYGVTNLHLVPTQMSRLLKLPDAVKSSFDGSSLVTVMHGAAPCPKEVKAAMLEWWGPVVAEYYGGTEGGFLTVATGQDWVDKPGTLGQKTFMADLRIADDDFNELPPGESGQIWFRSTLGSDFEYHNAEEKTASAHRDGWGTLGDIGYLDEDGSLFMSDRRIDMIISGGVNIYPAEIEGVLAGHPKVVDAAVFGIPDDEFGEQVKGAVELADGVEPSDGLEAELIAYCREHLAGYKAPRSIDIHEHLPRQPTGKLYKRLLRDPYWADTGRLI